MSKNFLTLPWRARACGDVSARSPDEPPVARMRGRWRYPGPGPACRHRCAHSRAPVAHAGYTGCSLQRAAKSPHPQCSKNELRSSRPASGRGSALRLWLAVGVNKQGLKSIQHGTHTSHRALRAPSPACGQGDCIWQHWRCRRNFLTLPWRAELTHMKKLKRGSCDLRRLKRAEVESLPLVGRVGRRPGWGLPRARLPLWLTPTRLAQINLGQPPMRERSSSQTPQGGGIRAAAAARFLVQSPCPAERVSKRRGDRPFSYAIALASPGSATPTVAKDRNHAR